MDDTGSPERHGPLGRFGPAVEPAFRAWYRRRIKSLGAAMGWASIVGWAAAPIFVTTYFATDHAPWLFAVCWGVNIPALLAGIRYMGNPEPRWAMVVGTVLVNLTAVDSIVVILPLLSGVEPTAFALVATFFGLLAPAVQLPFRETLLTGLLITAAGGWSLFTSAETVDQDVILGFGVIVIGCLLISPAMAFANERDLRTRFANERVIEYQRQLLRRYAPSAVVSRIEAGDASVDRPQRRRVTVLSSDVVGFTAMADRIDPEALAHIINDYLGSVSDLIERHGGTVTEFAGDGVMAIFGAPDDSEPVEQVVAAVGAAKELQTSLAEWSQAWHEYGTIQATSARVGINTGVVSVGTFGSAIRATYTGIGLQMNIAARVQAQAQPGGILLSNTSWHIAKDRIACEPRGEVAVKGVHFPIELYEPI